LGHIRHAGLDVQFFLTQALFRESLISTQACWRLYCQFSLKPAQEGIDPLNFRNLRISLAASLIAICTAHGVSVQAQPSAAKPPAQTDTTIPPQAILQPADLARMLNTSEKPLVLQTGSHVLYAEAHIPGAEYAGPAGTSAGIDALRARVTGLNKDSLIVIYCGCCPWGRCPNIRPAYDQLRTLGFTNVRALYLAENFGTDWVDKGYPVAKGR